MLKRALQALVLLSLFGCLLGQGDECSDSGEINEVPPPQQQEHLLYVVISTHGGLAPTSHNYNVDMYVKGWALIETAATPYLGLGTTIERHLLFTGNGLTADILNKLATNYYTQVWVADLSATNENGGVYEIAYEAIANWYLNKAIKPHLILDGRWISSIWDYSNIISSTTPIFGYPVNSGKPEQQLVINYYENIRIRGVGALVLLTDHDAFHLGINTINSKIQLNPFTGVYYSFPYMLETDASNPLVSYPADATHHHNAGKKYIWDDSSTGNTPYNIQPNGVILYPVGWHGEQGIGEPGVSTTIRGTVGFLVSIVQPLCDEEFNSGAQVCFNHQIAGTLPGVPPYTYLWSSSVDGQLSTAGTFCTSALSDGTHVVTLRVVDSQGLVAEAKVRIHLGSNEPSIVCGDGTTPTHPFGDFASLYNVFVFDDFSCKWGDTEGRLAAGGKVDLEGYGVGCKVFAQPNQHCTPAGSVTCAAIAGNGDWAETLVSGGDSVLKNVGIQVGNVVHGGSYTGQNLGITSDCSVRQDTPIDFSAEETYLKSVSTVIRDTPATGTVASVYGAMIFTGTLVDIEVFALDGLQLATANRIEFQNIKAGASVLVNVGGPNVQVQSLQFVNVVAEKTLWNFHEATILRFLYLSWRGSILAPLADVNGAQGEVHGQVIAKSWTPTPWGGCAEQHHVPFTGCAPVPNCRECGFFCDFEDLKWLAKAGGNTIEITPFIINTDIVSYYSYNSPVGSSSNSGLEQNNEDKAMLIFVLDSSNKHNLVVIYDIYTDSEGGSAVSLIEHDGVLDNTNFLLGDDPNEGLVKGNGFFETTHVWSPCCTDGYVIGPIPDLACFNFTLKATTGINSLRITSDGSAGGTLTEIPKANNEFIKVEICNGCLNKRAA